MTVDLEKRDAELKLLLNCTEDEKNTILNFLNGASMRAWLVRRDGELDWLRSRRSVRRFSSRPVEDNVLWSVLEAATWAPSAHNRQPWRFVVLLSLQTRRDLAQAMGDELRSDLLADGLSSEEAAMQVQRSYQRITGAPAAILLCLDETTGDVYPDPSRQQLEYWMGVQGVAMSGATLLLASHLHGLGGVWICAPLFAPQAARRVLDLPPTWQPQGLVLLGYPEKIPPARARSSVQEVTLFR